MKPTFLILSGPSCVGKGPLLAALRRSHPDLAFAQPVVHTSRSPRPGERDGVEFWFRDAATIRGYDPERYFVHPMRNQMRALDLDDIERLCAEHERVILELHPPQVAAFRSHPRVTAAAERFRIVTMLLQPVSPQEVAQLAASSGRPEAEVVAEVMRPKQIRRALGMGKLLTAAELHDVDVRAKAAWDEMRNVDGFDIVIVNHDAEGSDHWRHTPPIGDAGATLRRLVEALRGGPRGIP